MNNNLFVYILLAFIELISESLNICYKKWLNKQLIQISKNIKYKKKLIARYIT